MSSVVEHLQSTYRVLGIIHQRNRKKKQEFPSMFYVLALDIVICNPYLTQEMKVLLL